MDSQRRQFLKFAATGATLSASGSALAAPPGPGSFAVGMLIDNALCIGCKACMVACKEANNLPLDYAPDSAQGTQLSATTFNVIKAWTGTKPRNSGSSSGHAFSKQHCLHCIEPACATVCPTRAMEKDPIRGIVRHIPERCVGCRYCISACPFDIPRFAFDDPLGQLGKCGMCEHLLEQGRIPACCDVCPTGASLFGSLGDLQEEATRRLETPVGKALEYPRGALGESDKYPSHWHPAPRYQRTTYGQTELGGTQVLQLSAVKFDQMGLPTDLPSTPYIRGAERIRGLLHQHLLLPLLLLAGTSFLARRSLDPQYREHRKQIDEETVVMNQPQVTVEDEIPTNVRFGPRPKAKAKAKPKPAEYRDNLKARILAAYRRAMRDHGIIEVPLHTPAFYALMTFAVIALVLIGERLLFGLSSVSNANNGYPFSLWTTLNAVVGSGLGFAGYVITFAIYIFNRGEYNPLARSALTLSLLGYAMAGLAALLDMGRYWNLFYLLSPIHSNIHSILFESLLCLLAYILMLGVEFMPIALEHADQQRWKLRIERVLYLVIGIGLTAATYHQFSLGTLLIAAGPKLSPFWQSPLLPISFLLSAILMGLAALSVESLYASLRLESRLEAPLLRKLGSVTAGLLGLFVCIRLIEAGSSATPHTLFDGGLDSNLFIIEICLLLIAMWFALPAARGYGNAAQPFTAGIFILVALATYRVNAWLLGFDPGEQWHYFPQLSEILICLGMFASQILLYLVIVKKLPILRRAAPQLRPEDL